MFHPHGFAELHGTLPHYRTVEVHPLTETSLRLWNSLMPSLHPPPLQDHSLGPVAVDTPIAVSTSSFTILALLRRTPKSFRLACSSFLLFLLLGNDAYPRERLATAWGDVIKKTTTNKRKNSANTNYSKGKRKQNKEETKREKKEKKVSRNRERYTLLRQKEWAIATECGSQEPSPLQEKEHCEE